jgi:hypothetical protein
VSPAISRTSDSACASHTDYFKLWNNTTIANGICFADAGTLTGLNIYNVHQLTTGNNSGYLIDSNGNVYPFSAGTYYCHWETLNFSPAIPDVVQVTIVSSYTC